MPKVEELLKEMFAFQQFEHNKKFQNMIDDTCKRYENDSSLSADDLAAAAGGLASESTDEEGGLDL